MMIEVENLVRVFRVPARKGPSFLRIPLFGPKQDIHGISFRISGGECVGYLGPNGAGKSTTIKILSGILYPSSGQVRVAGMIPWERRTKYVQHIGVVFGQRSQLWWDLPLRDSFELLRDLYRVPQAQYRKNLEMLVDLLGLTEFLQQPVRQLSLGQRMRGDLAASLIHDPKVLFLDEPTIGLDLMAKDAIHNFLWNLSRDRGVTIILTTHNVDDIEKLCQRMIFIDRGRKIYDDSTANMIAAFSVGRSLVVEATTWPDPWIGPAIRDRKGQKAWFTIENDEQIANLVKEIQRQVAIRNLSIEEPRIEDVIKNIYQGAKSVGVAG